MRAQTVVLAVALAGCTVQKKPETDPNATIHFVTARDGDVAPLVAEQLNLSKPANRRVLVYVSAPWCEPCRDFHAAVDRGELTGKVGALDLLSFDADRDAERLLLSGYESRYIPAFSVPNPDGRASGKQIEGSVKGNAVSDLVPRLRELLQVPN